MKSARCRIVVVAAEPVMRYGLAAAMDPGYLVVDTVGTVAQASRSLARHRPAVCLVSFTPALPDAGVAEAAETLTSRQAGVTVVALFRAGEAAGVTAAYEAGVRAFVDTSVTPDELRAALDRATGSGVVVHPSLLPHLLDRPAPGRPAIHLTDRQLQALTLLAEGRSGKEIARMMGATMAAVNHHVERASERLGAKHRTHAVARAFQLGLLS